MMRRRIYIFAVLFLVSGWLAACNSATTTTFENTPAVTLKPVNSAPAQTNQANQPTQATTNNQPAPSPAKTESANPTATGVTMKQAYTLAEPMIKKWQADVVLVRILNAENIGISPDGRSLEWFFQAVSVKLGKQGSWSVKTEGGKANVTQSGDEELPTDQIKALASLALPPVANMIDSSELMNIAKQNGGDKSDRPIGFRLAMPTTEGAPLVFFMVFYQGSKTIPLRIDALTGKIIEQARG
jgi:hypothetical protein